MNFSRIFICLMTTVFLVLAVQASPAMHAEIQLHNGERLYGDVTEESDNDYKVVVDDTGMDRRVTKLEIKSLSFNDFTPLKSYPVLGATLGTPGGLMPVFGYHFGNFSLQASGMYLGMIAGAELEAQWKFIDEIDITQGLAITAGYSRIEQKATLTTKAETFTWTYAGPAYVLNWALFYLKAGVTFGSGSFTSPQFMGQIGILNRFNLQRVKGPSTPIVKVK